MTGAVKPQVELEHVNRLRLALTRLERALRQNAGGGITPSQYAVLTTLDRHGPMPLGELAQHEGVSPPSITRIVQVLEEKGLVGRTVSESDHRVATVAATAMARRTVARIRHQRNAWLAQRMAELNSGELDDLNRGTAALEHILELGR
jgi:DNA-binding MarR family transcriptional regulator